MNQGEYTVLAAPHCSNTDTARRNGEQGEKKDDQQITSSSIKRTLMVARHRRDKMATGRGEVMLCYDLLCMLGLSDWQFQRSGVVSQRGLKKPRLTVLGRAIILPVGEQVGNYDIAMIASACS